MLLHACLPCIQLSGGSHVVMTVNPLVKTSHGSYDGCDELVLGAGRTLPGPPEEVQEGSVPEDKKSVRRCFGTSSLQRSQEYADVNSAHFPPIQPSSEMPVVEEMETGMFPGQPPQQYAELCLADRHSSITTPKNDMFVVEYAKVDKA